MTNAKGYTGWELSGPDRERLLKKIPPAYPNVIAHHITNEFGVTADAIPADSVVSIVGVVDDGKGCQALVCAVGDRYRRPDGKRFHITWSLNPDRKPVDSNDVIAGSAKFIRIIAPDINMTGKFFS